MKRILLKLRLFLLHLMQRLRRSIWRRRSACLTRLTERQLRNLWKLESLTIDSPEKQDQANLLMAEMPWDLPVLMENRMAAEMMEDLQMASRQLTSMLTSREC